jgi:hypothetical protein
MMLPEMSTRMHKALAVGRKVLDALEILYSKTEYFMHDLLHANVMQSQSDPDEIKLIDFGIREDKTRTTVLSR